MFEQTGLGTRQSVLRVLPDGSVLNDGGFPLPVSAAGFSKILRLDTEVLVATRITNNLAGDRFWRLTPDLVPLAGPFTVGMSKFPVDTELFDRPAITFDGRYVLAVLDGGVTRFDQALGVIDRRPLPSACEYDVSLNSATDAPRSALVCQRIEQPETFRVVFQLIDNTTAPIGTPCAWKGDCLSGFCVDGVCCDVACTLDGGADCLACSVDAGAQTDGVCGIATAGASCRGNASTCDLPERCDGVSNECPADLGKDAGTVCAVSTLPCSFDALCDGRPWICPPFPLAAVGTPCRRNACAALSVCPGTSGFCFNSPSLPAGSSCDDGNPCDRDQCNANSVCVPTAQGCPLLECKVEVQCSLDGGCVYAPLTGAACDGGTCVDGGCVRPTDGGAADGGVTDAGFAADAGSTDGGQPDGGVTDAGADPDAGLPGEDAGTTDGGASDGGAAEDAGMTDAGLDDADAGIVQRPPDELPSAPRSCGCAAGERSGDPPGLLLAGALLLAVRRARRRRV